MSANYLWVGGWETQTQQANHPPNHANHCFAAAECHIYTFEYSEYLEYSANRNISRERQLAAVVLCWIPLLNILNILNILDILVKSKNMNISGGSPVCERKSLLCV